MKRTDRAILVSLLAAGLLAAFYFMVLSPKRDQASQLGDEISSLEASIAEQEQVAAFAEQARQDFPKFYGRMVVLGKAVPEGADSASLLVQLNSISQGAGVEFQGLQLAQGGESAAEAAAATPPPEATPPADGSTPSPDAGGEPAPETTPTGAEPSVTGVAAPATEATAANLPIGATVGAAGLPTLPYDVDFIGDFFEIADFVNGLDRMVGLREKSGQVAVDGRLMTIDGFALKGGAPGSSPELGATFLMTTYVTPSDQGLTLGATPQAPAPGQPEVTPAAQVTP